MKFSFLPALGVLMAFTASAAGYEEGVKYYKCGMLDAAKKILLKEVNNSEGVGTCCYYLGEIYFAEHKVDSASIYYKKGGELNVEDPYCLIGQAKVMLKTNADAAGKVFSQALAGKNKKDPALLLAVAKAYADNDMPQSDEYLEKAKSVDSKYADLYIFEGDRLAAEKKTGDACSRYEQAINLDPSCIEAYVKYARIYSGVNPQAGLDMLQKLQTTDPSSVIAAREMAEIYYAASRYGEAADSYEKFVASECCTTKELVRFATVLFHQGKYERSLLLARKVLEKETDNVIMKRIVMYDLYSLKNYEEGLQMAEKFFSAMAPDDCIAQDYLFYGRLLLAEKKTVEALPVLKKALTLDTNKVDIYKEMAIGYEKINQYDSAIVYYSDFLEKGRQKVTMADWFMVGKYHYFASDAVDSLATDTVGRGAARLVHLNAADSIFGYVAEKIPDSYLGNFWRARVNSALDPESEKGLSRPYYEAAMNLLEKNSAGKTRFLVECYSYLGYYHFLKNEIAQSKDYWSKILSLEPENDVAKKALEGMK